VVARAKAESQWVREVGACGKLFRRRAATQRNVVRVRGSPRVTVQRANMGKGKLSGKPKRSGVQKLRCPSAARGVEVQARGKGAKSEPSRSSKWGEE